MCLSQWIAQNCPKDINQDDLIKILPELAERLKIELNVAEVEVIVGIQFDELEILMLSGRAA